jgi:arabinofuranosyltransferase
VSSTSESATPSLGSTPARQSDRRPPRAASRFSLRPWPCLVALLAAELGLCVYFGRFALMDDAFVTFRYVLNFLHGHGLVFNVGERTEGYSSFLWLMLLCVPTKLGISPVLASRIFGAAFLLGTVVLTASFLPARSSQPVANRLLAPLLVVSNAACAFWAVHGLETTMFMFLLALAVRADARDHGGTEFVAGWSGLWYGLLALTRPEGALVFGASFAFWIAVHPRRVFAAPIWRHALRFAVVVVPHELWRLYYYGELLPNTYYAKVGHSLATALRGGEYLLDFFVRGRLFVMLAVVPALVAARHDRRLAFLAWMVASFFAITVWEGGDAVPAWRFLVPIVPVLAVLAGEGVHELRARIQRPAEGARPLLGRTALQTALWLLLLVGIATSAHATFITARYEAVTSGGFTRTMSLVGESLRRHLPPATRIALNPIGAVPYYSRLYAYDMLGLTDYHIGHRPIPDMGTGAAGHEKGDGAYILDRAPEVILFGNVMVVPPGPLANRRFQWRPIFRSEIEIAADARARMYVPDELPLSDGRHLIFLRRRDFVIDRAGQP